MKKHWIGITAVLCGVLAISARPPGVEIASYDDFARVIRANDLAALRKLASGPDAVNVENKLHAKPLHYAVVYGSVEAVRILLAAGADTSARNQQAATPLIYGAWNAERTKLLVDKGADVNAAAKDGSTPLMTAATTLDGSGSLEYLLAHGADAKAMDKSGADSLMRATDRSDPQATQLLLASGADARLADRGGFTALQGAASLPGQARLNLLLKGGADVNSFNTFSGKVKNGPIALHHITPLMAAVSSADTPIVEALLKAGAHVNDVDIRKMSALMFAVATDRALPGTVKQLIAAGADVNAKDQNGESVLDWARKFGNPAILSALQEAGAEGRALAAAPQPPAHSEAVTVAAALERAMPLLAKNGPEFFREGGGCNGCHHQSMEARVYGAAADGGVHVNENLRQNFKDALLAERPAYLGGLPLLQALPGHVDRILASVMALADLHAPADEFTDAAVHYLAARQDASGAWTGSLPRPPMESSDISRTGMAIRAFRVYGWPARQAEFDARIQRARVWLEQAQPVTTYEAADRIVGLQAAGASPAILHATVESLLSQQRSDGGWAQNPYLESDAYATGLTLHNLYAAGVLAAEAPAYQKGVAFLLRTQFPDGSWYVRSRSPKLQPYFKSGFPFDHDQWISSSGTAWAAMALSHAAKVTALTARAE